MNLLVRHLLTALIAAFCALALNFATAQDAQAQGFEIDAAFGWHGHVSHGHDMHGFQLVLSPCYRFNDWIGVYLDEGFGGHWYNHDRSHHYFVGQSIVGAKFIYNLGQIDLFGKVGLGALYNAGDHWSDGAFAFKLGIGATYDLTGQIGIGANFDYTLGAWENANISYLDFLVHVRFKF